jgi:hypothetical protein
VYYVKPPPGGSDANPGASWAQAKATIGAAWAAAGAGDEVWVAAGTYPERLHNPVVGGAAVDVALYGGFAGTETAREQRDPQAHPTVIDGTESGTCITISDGAGPGTRVDGFVITRGLGGVSIVGSAPVIANNVIRANRGPGVFIRKYQILQVNPPLVAHPQVTGNTIVDNVAANGAGIAVTGDLLTNLVPPPASAPVISGNVVARNTASQNGGGIGCWGHTAAVIENNHVVANAASTFEVGWDGDDPAGAWIVGGGGVFATKNDMAGQPVQYAIAAPSIRNNVVAANGALIGAGICLIDYPRLSEPHNPPPVVANNTVVANNGSGIYWGNTFPTVVNNIVAYNTWGMQQGNPAEPVVAYNDVFGNQVQGAPTNYQGLPDQTGSNGNLSVDPRFARYELGELHLQPDSPCIDAGSAAAVDAAWTDIEGQPRVQGAGVDLGADESDGTLHPAPWPVVHVSPTGSDAQDGATWATAKRTVTAGIARAASTGGDVWVAQGTYPEHVAIPPFVYLYGGFAGTETTRDQRDVEAHPAVLDGGGVPTVVLSRNAGYLVSALDGFTVRNGGTYRGNVVPDWSWGVEGRGGAIRSVATGIYIRNNRITENSLGNPFDNANRRAHGAGIHGYLSHSVIADNAIVENEILNTFDGSGAGMYFKLSMPTIERNLLARNHARYGSAVHCLFSIPKIAGNTIEENAMYNTYPLPLYLGSVEGAVTLDMGEDFLVEGNVFRANTAGTGAGLNVKSNFAGRIRSNLFVENVAYDPTAFGGMGGGIYALVLPGAVDHHYILNNTLVGNIATYALLPPPMNEQGGGIAISLPVPIPPPATMPPGKLTVANNILVGNSSGIYQTATTPMLGFTLEHNNLLNLGIDYRDVTPAPTDISADPLFADAGAGNYRLTPASPCVDAGLDLWGLAALTDLEGKPRVADGNGDGLPVVDMGAYEHRPPPATAVTLTPSVASPQPVGTSVTFTAAGLPQGGSYEYRFWLKEGTAWNVVRNYATTATWTWNTTGKAEGTYYVQVDCRAVGSAAAKEASKVGSFVLTAPATPATGVTLSPSPASPQPVGTNVTFTAAGLPQGGSYEYRFWLKEGSAWSVVRNYATTPTWTWNTSGKGAATYYVQVDCRAVGSTAAKEASRVASYVLTPPPTPATSVSLTPSLPSPRPVGTSITFTAAALPEGGTYEYRFWLKEGSVWRVVQNYSTTPTWTWNTAGKAEGTYYVQVDCRAVGSTAPKEASRVVSYVLSPPATPATGVNLAANLTSPQPVGTNITFTAAGLPEDGTYEYRFWLKEGSVWSVVRSYSPSPTWTWNTAGKAAGNYSVQVDCRAVGSTANREAAKVVAFTLE